MMAGGCWCGEVRYEIEGRPWHETVCHCATCRRIAGAPMVAWFTVRPPALRWVAGTPKEFRSSAAVTRRFCGRCGTPLTYARDDLPDEVDVTLASLDDPSALPPRDQTRVSERIAWVAALPDLPRFSEGRGEAEAAPPPD